ncbi:MAG: hypothetical protein KDA22_02325, partial [Phycisphaerales bacterium]|nr:hypothetical protein [Phycisphaerales bacterium]
MKELGDRLARLDGLPSATVGLILRHAFASAESAEATGLAEAMIRHEVELPLVIARLDHLDRSVMDRMSEPSLDLSEVLAEAMAGSEHARRNAIELIRRRAAPAEAALLLPAIGSPDHRDDGVGAAAATVLLELVDTPFGSGPRGAHAAQDRTALGEIVGAATLRGDGVHHHALLLAGLLLTERDEGALNDWVDRLDDLSRMALRGVVGRIELSTVRRRLLRWLGRSALRQQVARRWHQATASGPAAISDLLEDGHLLRTPSRAKALRLADRPARCLPDPAVANALPERLQAYLPDLLGSVGLTHRSRIERLAGCNALPSAVARLRGLLALRAFDRPDAAAAAIAYLRDRDRSVARTAFQVLHGWPVARSSPELLEALAREAPSDLATHASTARAALQPAYFFAAAPLLDPPALACAAWRLHARLGRAFIPPLREAIVAG